MNAAPQSTDNPFPGLRPYSRDQKLFGRDRDLVLFKDRLYSARTTLLFAGSGVGKSSFLQAKAVPALEDEHLVVSHARWGARAPLEAVRESWLQALTRRLVATPSLRESSLPNTSGDERAVRAALDALWPSDASPLELARRFAELDTVLLLDQFEEPLNSLVSDPAVDALVDALTSLINETKLPLRVVFSMRQEFLAELSLFENRIPDLFANYHNLRHPTPEQAATIISLTATGAGAKFDGEGVDALVQDLLLVGGLQTGTGFADATRPLRFVVPPVLQIVCSRMWNRDAAKLKSGELAFAAGYRRGHAREVVQSFVDELIAKLDSAQQGLLSKALDFLVSRQGGKVAYEVGALAQHLRSTPEELNTALELLATEPDRVFRRIARPDGSIWYELYHDVYAGALSCWKARFDAELERKAQERVKGAAKKSQKQTAWGCAAMAVFIFVIGGGSTAWNAGEHRDALRDAGDDYAAARKAYDAVAGNFLKTVFGWFDPDEELAKFWDRRAQSAALLDSRENALVCALEALATNDTNERRRHINAILGDDLTEIAGTRHTEDPIGALSANGERFATLGRGGVQVGSVEPAPRSVQSSATLGMREGAGDVARAGFDAPRVQFGDVLFSADGSVVWALGARAPDIKGSLYEQKAPASGSSESEVGMWKRQLDQPSQPERSWAGPEEFGLASPAAWSISTDGSVALCAWKRDGYARLVAFGDEGRSELGNAVQVDPPEPDLVRKSLERAWQVALSPDGSQAAFPGDWNAVVEKTVGGDGAQRVVGTYDTKPRSLRYSPDGRVLAVATESGGLHLVLLDAATATALVLSLDAIVFDLAFDPQGERLYATTVWGLEAWNLSSGQSEGRIRGPLSSSWDAATDKRGVLASWRPHGSESFLARFTDTLAGAQWTRFQFDREGEGWPRVATRSAASECVVAGKQTLRRIAMPIDASASSQLAWNGPVKAALSADGVRALVFGFGRYALIDVVSGHTLAGPTELSADEFTVSFDFDEKGEHAFVIDADTIRELGNDTQVQLRDVSDIRRTFAVSGEDLLVEAGGELLLVRSREGGSVRVVAQPREAGYFLHVAIDSTRQHVAAVYSTGSIHAQVTVWGTEQGAPPVDVGRPFDDDGLVALALDRGGRRVATAADVDGRAVSPQRYEVRVVEVSAEPNPVSPAPIALRDMPLALAFTPDGSAVVARTANALVRIPLADAEAKPSVRYLKRASIVHEDVPNWFDADDPSGERPRVLVLDSAGRLVLERVRFDNTDVAPIEGTPDDLKSRWRERLDLSIDGDGRVVVPSSSGGGSSKW